jgi:hypothetical protein
MFTNIRQISFTAPKHYWICLSVQWVLHDWSDENCIKILKNCRKAIQQKSGKVIIVDIVLEKDRNDLFDETRMAFDLLMAHTTG